MALTVLVADDDPLIRRQLMPLLTRLGLDIVEVADGAAAWAAMQVKMPQLAIIDWMMPGMDGLELCQRLRRASAEQYTYVIMLTGASEREHRKQAMAAGVDDFLAKPLDRVDLETRITVARRILDMQEKLVEHRQRMQDELKAAAKVQARMLPDAPPAVAGLDCAWHWQPCDELAGDTLGVTTLADGRVAFHVLDVAGHGVRSALLAVQVGRILQRDGVGPGRSPAAVLAGLNREFPFQPATLQYFTMLLGVLDPRTWTITLGHAAHPGPLLITADGPRTLIRDCSRRSVPVGIYPDELATFEESTLELPPGGTLLLYSDGVTEAMDPQQACFGDARLHAAITAHRGPADAAGLVRTVVAALDAWRAGGVVSDDISLLAIRRSG